MLQLARRSNAVSERIPVWRMRVFCQVFALILLFFLVTPDGAGAWTVFGDKLVGRGPLIESEYKLFGRTLSPSLDLNGTGRFNYIGGRIDAENSFIFAPQLNLDMNLQLTARDRIHALFRPFDHGVSGPPGRPGRATQWRAKRGRGQRKSTAHKLDFEPDRIWFEIEPFTWLSPQDRVPLDILVAGGRIPLVFHNQYWMNEDVLGFAVSKNNIYVPALSNLNVIMFGAFEEMNRFQDAQVAGIGAFIDYKGYFVEATFAYAFDKTIRNDRFFSGISVTKQVGLTGFALRVLLNEDDGVQGGPDLGALFVVESETPIFLDEALGGAGRLYVNAFYGTRNYAPLGAGNVGRQGFLFRPDRSIQVPTLIPRGTDSGGGVVGFVFNAEGDVTVTPEVGFVRDERRRSRTGRRTAGNLEQIGLGLRIQGTLAKFLIPGSTFPWFAADFGKIEERLEAGLYGLQLRTTWYNIIPTAGQTQHALRIELLYDF